MTATSVANGVETLLSQLLEHLFCAADFNADDVSRPAAVLWPDKAEEWASLVPTLRGRLPQLLTLGAYNAETRTGPAIWLKCAIAAALPEANIPVGAVPIIYLPGVSLKDLRAVEECPRALQPLAELQYRGRVWAQVNGRDWTLLAFLTAADALGLEVARDAATAEAIRRALLKLAYIPVNELSGRRLDSYDFDELLSGGDSVRDVLRWIDAPVSQNSTTAPDGWAAFRNICKKDYGFDPALDGRIGAAERLGQRDGKWRKVWERFAEAPALYPGVPEALRQGRPQANTDLFTQSARGSWPQDNEYDERTLRSEFLKLGNSAPSDVASHIIALEQEHGERRSWVWSTLRQAPLAAALKELHTLATAVVQPVHGTTRDGMAESYRTGSWKADAAVLAALQAVREHGDVQAVRTAIRALYLPWLAQSADRLQSCIEHDPLPVHVPGAPSETIPERTIVLFVDGLRFDVSERLCELIGARGWRVQGGWRWSALPSVTPTAKPAVSPVDDLLVGDYMAQEFTPNVGKTSKPLVASTFRALLDTCGVQYLTAEATGNVNGRAWTELGDLDSYGHEQGWKLAWRVPEVLSELVTRVGQLLAAGWNTVRIVTDHGWLLVPGGLPKTDLPGYVADARWARCAVLKSGATPDVPLVPWYWNPHISVAVAPGVTAFIANVEYAHGGISLQECVTPMLEVTSGVAPARSLSIVSAKWAGLGCRVTLAGDVTGCTVDLRTFAANAQSSIAEKAKKVESPGEVRLLVPDEAKEGCSVQVVVLDTTGAVIAKHPTTVGDQ